MTGTPDGGTGLPRALRMLWHDTPPARRTGGLSRDRIVAAAIDLADAEGLGALSMARLAQRLGCGTMSLYRHIANKDELVVFMLASAPGPPPAPQDPDDWRSALTAWADGLWEVYHRHPWVLQAASSGPPADPGQLAWLDVGLSALGSTGLNERDKLSAVISLLHYVRGAAALAIDSASSTGGVDWSRYPDILRQVIDPARFPAIAVAVEAGVFDGPDPDDPRRDFVSGVQRVLDGIETQLRR